MRYSEYFACVKKGTGNIKWVNIILHALAWLAIFALPFWLMQSSDKRPGPPRDMGFIYFYIATRPFWIGFFYLNAYFLYSRIAVKKKHILNLLTQAACLLIISVAHWFFFNLFVRPSNYNVINFLAWNAFTYFFILAASIAYRVILDKIESDKAMQAKENENLKTELSFLRSQVSPHFMFNVLNNMVALARKKSELLEPSLIKLSSLMRYMIYETDVPSVPLEKEIDYLQSYIDLQQQRFGKNLTVNFRADELNGNYELEPMLLIPFVENAFKHGTGMIENPRIEIDLGVRNNILNFTVRNKFSEETQEIKDQTSGIGLTNVQRRLNLLYGKDHSLLITRKDSWFIVSLQLNLH